MHGLPGNSLSLFTAAGFGIKANNRFGIGFPQVHPSFGHIHFHSIHLINIIASIGLFKSSKQLISMYTDTLGAWTRPVIALVAFITMFSTTLTVMDGYARTLGSGFILLAGARDELRRKLYPLFLVAQIILAVLIISRFLGAMKSLVDIVTVTAFLAAPVVAGLNFRVMFLPTVPQGRRLGRAMIAYCSAGLVFLVGFSVVWVKIRWF